MATAAAAATATLEERIVALERKHHKCPNNVTEVDDSMRRARTQVESLGLYSANWKWVPEPYYTWPLDRRAKVLGAPSTSLLCKSLLLENRKATDQTHDDMELHPRFVLVVLQYDAELSTDLLTKSVRRLQPKVERRLDASSHFDWRVADPDDNDRITGYQFNSVTPFGLKEEVPIYLSKTVADIGYFWMGGGQ
jgi:prolyl-tRNA editing enzyme YbaK/EbsC (Cys-tRNA(Pro) deacylase)